jgi:hypothetical protein
VALPPAEVIATPPYVTVLTTIAALDEAWLANATTSILFVPVGTVTLPTDAELSAAEECLMLVNPVVVGAAWAGTGLYHPWYINTDVPSVRSRTSPVLAHQPIPFVFFLIIIPIYNPPAQKYVN